MSSETGSTVARLEKVQRTEEEYQRVLRGIEEGDPAVLGATEPSAIGPGAGYDQDDLARDLGIEPGDRALPRAVSAYIGAFTDAFWQETERAATTPARTRHGPPPLDPPEQFAGGDVVAAARCPVDVSTYPRRHVIVVKHAGERQTFSVHEVAHTISNE